MGFFGLFRSKEEKLAEAISEVYRDAVPGTFKSSIAVERMIEEKLEVTLEPSANYELRCEIFCFYAHVVDYLSWGTLSERGQNLVTSGLSFGIEQLVESSLSKTGDPIWDPNITDSLTLMKRNFDSLSKKLDLVERNLFMGIEYYRSHYGFVSDITQALQRGDPPGITDALSGEPDSKVSRLVQNVYKTLQAHIPELGPDLDILRERPDTLGSDAGTMEFVELCRTIHTSVYAELSEINPLGKLQKMERLIQ